MSVIIKGMEMPMNCGSCPLRASCVHRIYLERRPEYCPLTTVPKHGRLIDADALIQMIDNTWNGRTEYRAADIYYFVKDAPAIIPAEGGET